jgi:hypothetical protein
VLVHHDLSAWIFVWFEFECLKNEFERNLKKKRKQTNSSLPLSLSSPARKTPGRLAFLLSRASKPAHVGPTPSPRRPNTPAPSLFFCSSHWRVGPGRQARLPPPAGSATPHPARRRPLPAGSINSPPSKPCNWAQWYPSFISPLLIRPLSFFNPLPP